METPSVKDRIYGCIFGGALGDAMGYPVESSTLEAVLRSFTSPARITDVAESLRIRTGAVSAAVKTLLAKDMVEKLADGRYVLVDPTFALWLRHQVDFRQAMPPLLVGTDAEQAVAGSFLANSSAIVGPLSTASLISCCVLCAAF